MCNTWHSTSPGENCTCVAEEYGISASLLIEWNPLLGSDCSNFTVGCDYCVSQNKTMCSECDSEPVTSTIWVVQTSPPPALTTMYTTTTTPNLPWAGMQTYATPSTNRYVTTQSCDDCGEETSTAAYPKPTPSTTYQWLKPSSSTPECLACDEPGGNSGITGKTAPGGVSTDGKCGEAHMGANYTTCTNSAFGYCCSTSGVCGNSTQDCLVPYCDPNAGFCSGYANSAVRLRAGFPRGSEARRYPREGTTGKKWNFVMLMMMGLLLERLLL